MRIITEEELRDILEAHKKWLKKEEGGKRADLSGVDLRGEDFRCLDLRYVNFSNANLTNADLRYADLRYCRFVNTDLTNCLLDYAELDGIQTNKNCYQVTGVGSERKLVSYFVKEDIVVCGCWECEGGNTLKNLKKRVERVYGKKGLKPNEKYYKEYMKTIKFFQDMKELQND